MKTFGGAALGAAAGMAVTNVAHPFFLDGTEIDRQRQMPDSDVVRKAGFTAYDARLSENEEKAIANMARELEYFKHKEKALGQAGVIGATIGVVATVCIPER